VGERFEGGVSMIRKFHPEDMEKVMEIWLLGNFRVHNFIPKKYWEENYDEVKSVFSLAYVYVNVDDGDVNGFIALMENYVVAHFVREDVRGQGIGKALLDYVKDRTDELTLSIYEKNMKAAEFYLREDFEVQSERIEDSTGECTFLMEWTQ
jgi:GNAT superfamily N-acetyltransferase